MGFYPGLPQLKQFFDVEKRLDSRCQITVGLKKDAIESQSTCRLFFFTYLATSAKINEEVVFAILLAALVY